MKKVLLQVAVGASSVLAMIGTAQGATTSFNVGATITATCAASATPVDFGAVVSGNGASTTGSVDVTCTSGTPYTIALDSGQNYDGTDRRIRFGTSSDYLIYTLIDNLSTLPWGDDTYNGASVSGTGTGGAQSYTVDATLIGAGVPAGYYSDTVTVTVTY